ncbi:MAG: orotate phosphoribosyltransferase [Capsulimonadaceae bacterium]|nr:orotate phosphoribosyltransferase [Capsulimonadaceae bacterium]
MLSSDEVYRKFVDASALLEGHFLLSSGRHSPTYLEKFLVLQYPRTVEAFCAEIARRFAGDNIEVVLGPTTGGVLLAYEVAKNLGTRGIFAEAENGKRVLRRGFALKPGERVLLVDDILTTGGSVRDTIAVIDEAGATLAGIAVLADRSGGKVDFGVRLEALLTLDVEQYEAADCPQCKAGIPLTKRGTTAAPKMR